jgi:hypothetical protein
MSTGLAGEDHPPYLCGKLFEAMPPYLTSKCLFANLSDSCKSHFAEAILTEEMKELGWLKPKLVTQISSTEWMNYRLLVTPRSEDCAATKKG